MNVEQVFIENNIINNSNKSLNNNSNNLLNNNNFINKNSARKKMNLKKQKKEPNLLGEIQLIFYQQKEIEMRYPLHKIIIIQMVV